MVEASEVERRTARIYRWVLVIGVVLVIALTAWMLKPPTPVDLTFLGSLSPRIASDDDPIELEFNQSVAEVETLLDRHLTRRSGWTKAGSGGAYATYSRLKGYGPEISLSPRYPPAPRLSVPKPATPKPDGTTMTIYDHRGAAVLPRVKKIVR